MMRALWVAGLAILAAAYPAGIAGVKSACEMPQSGAQRALLRAGVARVDITPETPVALEGYLEPENRISTGIHDRLYVRVIALEAGSRKLVLISCDIGSFMFAGYYRNLLAKEFKLSPESIWLCATHTHSGPVLSLNRSYPHPNNFTYSESFRVKVVSAAGEALRSMRPARAGFGRGQCHVGVNRRKILPNGVVEMASNPDGPTDPEVAVVAISDPVGAPLAAFFAYSCHSRTLNSANRLISGDLLGIAEQHVEKAVGGRYVCAAFAGASGDIDPVSVVSGFGSPDDPGAPETVRLADNLGEEVVRALRSSRPEANIDIMTAAASVLLPRKNPAETKALQLAAARIGDIALIAMDCEALVEVGLAVKAASPLKNTIVVTNCNGWNGYLPPGHRYPEGGYEVGRSAFGPAAAGILVSHAIKMLQALRPGA